MKIRFVIRDCSDANEEADSTVFMRQCLIAIQSGAVFGQWQIAMHGKVSLYETAVTFAKELPVQDSRHGGSETGIYSVYKVSYWCRASKRRTASNIVRSTTRLRPHSNSARCSISPAKEGAAVQLLLGLCHLKR